MFSLNPWTAVKKTVQPSSRGADQQHQSFDAMLRDACAEIDRLIMLYKDDIRQWMQSEDYQRYS